MSVVFPGIMNKDEARRQLESKGTERRPAFDDRRFDDGNRIPVNGLIETLHRGRQSIRQWDVFQFRRLFRVGLERFGFDLQSRPTEEK